MTDNNLITKHRPNSLDTYLGNKQLKYTIKNMLAQNKLPNAILISGTKGSGKTTLARIIAKELECHNIDLLEANIANTTGIDFIRGMIESAEYKPLDTDSKTKVYILDEAHQMTTQASNALLKLIEEPKPWCYFILCTTDPQKVLPTIRSRTTIFEVKPLDGNDFVDFVDDIYCKEKGIDINDSPLSEKFLGNLYEATGGEPRSILSNLAKVLMVPSDKLDKFVFENINDTDESCNLARVLYSNSTWKVICEELNKIKTASDVESTRRAVLGYATAIVCKGVLDRKASIIISKFIQPFFNNGSEKASLVNACIEVYNEK